MGSFWIFNLLVIVTLFNCFFETGHAISCYNCNSGVQYDGDACENIKANGNENFIKNCTELGVIHERLYERCRTMVQDVEGERRIIRSCATYPDKSKENRCVDRTGTSKIKLTYCDCDDKDLCNGVSMLVPSISTILMVFVIFILH